MLNGPLCHDSISENHWHSFTMIIKSVLQSFSNPNIYGTIFHLSQTGHVLHILWYICQHLLLLSGSHHGDRNNQSNYWTSVMECTSFSWSEMLQKFTGSQNTMRRVSSGFIWINANLISLRWRSVPPAGTHQKSCKSFWKTFGLSFNLNCLPSFLIQAFLTHFPTSTMRRLQLAFVR